ncbi:MAG: hypothetical protein AB7G44_09350 [Bacteroidia bacterium]
MNKILKPAALIFALSAIIVSCNNNDDEGDDLNAVYNNAASQTAYNDVVSIGDESVIDDDLSSFKTDDAEKISAPCATITKGDTNDMPNVTTIDFGSVNCLCNDGKYRRGKIVINHPPPSMARDSGAIFHHEFIDHYVNDNKMLGYVDVTNIGFSPLGHQHFMWDVVGGLELADGEGTISWESHQVKAYLEGFNTPNIRLDDKIALQGESSGTTQTGETYTAEIDSTAALKRSFSVDCRKHFYAGTVTVTPQGKPARIVNFGADSPEVCDDIAEVTVNGHTYTISLDDTHE